MTMRPIHGGVGASERAGFGMAQTPRLVGRTCVALGTVAWVLWLAGRLASASAHPLWIALFATEVIGVLTGAVVAVAIARRSSALPSPDAEHSHRRDSGDRYPTAIASLLGIAADRTPRAAVRGAWRPAFSARIPIAGRALALARFEGSRRLVAILGLALCLLFGVAPLERPTPWLLAAGAAGLVLTSVGTTLLAGGSIRPGDRLSWSFASIGLTVGPAERTDAMPVRWAGVMASIVVLNLAVALRGLSDRWTHGLPPMADTDRLVAMSAALLLIVGALATLRRLQPPEPTPAHVARRLEERSARQTALGATAIAGLIGLLAGILPGSVDAAHGEPVDREQRSQVQPVVTEIDPHPSEVGNRLVSGAEMPAQRSDEP
jgi:hypothetical protein